MEFVKTLLKFKPVGSSKHSPIAIKKVIKSAENMGFAVTGIKANPDGSFFVETAKDGKAAVPGNYWDKVLPK
ncbi:hypothetical protein [Mesorhizobium sp. IMUNJ 23232]|uniref:hypothetical protein n=1 Tax=Mesorhizobium sp. IMUNJ 23232 TaxID=3376064 RepID=UPI0037B912BD